MSLYLQRDFNMVPVFSFLLATKPVGCLLADTLTLVELVDKRLRMLIKSHVEGLPDPGHLLRDHLFERLFFAVRAAKAATLRGRSVQSRGLVPSVFIIFTTCVDRSFAICHLHINVEMLGALERIDCHMARILGLIKIHLL